MTSTLALSSQENLTFQKPPQEILELVDVQRAPTISIDKKGEKMLFLYRDMFLNLEDLNEEEMRLAGLRINPILNTKTANRYFNNIKIKTFEETDPSQIENLPEKPKIANLTWSPDKKHVAFTHTAETGLELWIINLERKKAQKLTAPLLNGNLGTPFCWSKNSQTLLVKFLPENRSPLIDKSKNIPSGPIIQNSLGQASNNRTYQDLLQDQTDETNFESLVSSVLYMVDLNGNSQEWAPKDMYIGNSFSPDGNFVLISTLTKPFSYTVPLSRFPLNTSIYTKEGAKICDFHQRPLQEIIPKGFMSTSVGKRSIGWRADKASSLFWVEALDGGDPANKVDYRDAIYQVDAPFNGEPQCIAKTQQRFSHIVWGNDQFALLYDVWWDTRNRKTYVFNPSQPNVEKQILFDRNYQEIYDSPGVPATEENEFGHQVLKLDGSNIYLIGDGFSKKGKFPFINLFDLKTKKKTSLYQAEYTDKNLDIFSILDYKKRTFLARIESPSEYPNYYTISMKNGKAKPISDLKNPFEKMNGISKEVIKYQRKDGVELSGILYLPKGYDRKEKLPMIMWAYPTEYKDKSSAGQSYANPNEFIFPHYGSPIYWVMRGYAVLDNAAFPIIGEKEEEPNDSFIEQLIMNAEAAIDAIDALGYIDRNKVAIGGHSYGAFMTANLLSHSDLFAAGIARSGAYNRTLTPFGFQQEQRNYWEAKHIYDKMSPFMHAEKMKTPLLLIHGASDNNAGTHTMQSERYFGALKGLGAPARLVLLPMESHGYIAKENILHLLWEQDQWLEKYVKNR